MIDPSSAKAALRREMRQARRSVPNPTLRSEAIWEFVEALSAVRRARRIMLFESIPGEPVTEALIGRRRAAGQVIVLPEDVPAPDPDSLDVVIVPGVAFTTGGERLGQGGGWYDRFLERLPPTSLTIGVGFEVQICDELPVEPHDVRLDVVVTEDGVRWIADRPRVSLRNVAAADPDG